jgi:flagellar hook-basal body complex protein FliE
MNIPSVLSSHVNHLDQIGHQIGHQNDLGNVAQDESSPSFASLLDKSVSDVNRLLNESDKKTTEVAIGKSENIHEAMISFEKADVALKLMVQVRNKAIDAYHEIMRMQV